MDDVETVERQIAAWSEDRPSWQRGVLRGLASGARFTRAKLEAIADDLIAGEDECTASLIEADLSTGASEASATITLESIGDIANVNGLIEGETLTFGSGGLTVVYGKNASGKSGYARLIKAVSEALHEEPVHRNVFNEDGDGQRAKIVHLRNGDPETAIWPESVDDDLRAIRFYDKACGTKYITRESELTYRPSALTLLDGLIDACGELESIFDQRLEENAEEKGELPNPPEGSDAAVILESLTALTTQQEIDEACHAPEDVDEHRKALSQREARLLNSDPTTERRSLDTLADQAEGLVKHIATLEESLSDQTVASAVAARDEAVNLREAAELAFGKAFGDEPLAGVGSETWRVLWEAARRFSAAEAYHEHEFPVTGQIARCVLCHQQLGEDAADRLTRFETFVQNQTEKQAGEAESAFAMIRKGLDGLVVKSPEVAEDLVELRDDNPKLGKRAARWLKAAEKRRMAAVARIGGKDEEELPALDTDVRERLATYAKKQRKAAAEIDDAKFKKERATVVTERANFEGRVALSKKKSVIEAEVERLKKREAIAAAKGQTDTGPITRQSSTIMNRSVTADVLARFRTEAQRMELHQVELTAVGGKKGKFQQRPALADTDTRTPIEQVLSEGEQTALGLAGFFTEAHFDASQSTLVFDDPVTSLDHLRRASVADRIVDFAKQRQVIVFTHDLTFVMDLTKSMDREGMVATERRVERVGNIDPGKVGDSYPWQAKDVGKRFNALENSLSRIKSERPSWGDEDYAEACGNWAGLLSQTWEQILHLDVVNQVFDMGKFEVRPLKFRILGAITPEDDGEFQESYGRCSLWASRHNKAAETNYSPPEPDQLEEELKRVRAWQKRIKSYR